jgi:hypothetical protein
MSEIAALWTKLTTGLNRTPSTDFERVLARFDELHKLRADRELTKEERRIYNKLASYIYTRFETMFNQFDEKMVGRLQPRQQQRGGGADDEKSENNDNFLMNIWKWVKDKYNAFMESIRAAAEENQRKALDAVTPANMMKILGVQSTGVDANIVADQINTFDNKIKDALTAIQKTVTHGVGNAASAAIDVFLNALSMMPVFGTALLTWRIFQNLLVIVGASMSVQATNVSVGREVLEGIEEAKKGPAVIAQLEQRAEQKDIMNEELKNTAAKKKEEKENGSNDIPTTPADEQSKQDPSFKDPKLAVDPTKAAKISGGTRKTKNRNRGNNIASYARKIHKSLKRFHKLGVPNHRKYNYAPPTSTAYALKLA